MVKDENDLTRRVLWWGGADWSTPEGLFDLACVVRASNFRGQRDVQVEWIDARPLETESIDLRRTLTVLDQRELEHPLPVLQSLLAEAQTEGAALVWAEANAAERLSAAGIATCDRTLLAPARTLILWSTPPGRAELQAAMEAVSPQTVIVFGVNPADASLEAFVKRLAGLAKYAVEKKGGLVDLSRLACATGQRDITVRLGLQWLEQRGLVQVTDQPDGQLHLSPGQPGTPGAERALQSRLRMLLEETSAYRRYFTSADKDYLL